MQCHGVVVLLMGLHILSIFVLAVVVVIDHLASDDGARAQGLRDAV